MKMILRWAQRFVVAYGIIMLATFFMCLFFNPTSQLAVVPFFGRCIVLTLVCMATLIVYYTKGELSVRGMVVPHNSAYLPAGNHIAAAGTLLAFLVRPAGCSHLRILYPGSKNPVAHRRFWTEYADRSRNERLRRRRMEPVEEERRKK